MTALDKLLLTIMVVFAYWLFARLAGRGYSRFLLRPSDSPAAFLGALALMPAVGILGIIVTVFAFEVQGIGWMWVLKTILALFSLAGAGLACLSGLYLGRYKV